MKKIILTVFIMLSMQNYTFAKSEILDFKYINLNNESSRILYEYFLQKMDMSSEEINSVAKISKNSVIAYEFDLNSDGENEIIGTIYSTMTYGSAGYELFILQKFDDKYVNIIDANFEPQKNIYILNSKTNGFRDIKFYGGLAYGFKPFVAQYKNKFYKVKPITR